MRSLMNVGVFESSRCEGFRHLSRLRDVIAEVREGRRKIEAELFRNRYHLVSKNDDDLPIVR